MEKQDALVMVLSRNAFYRRLHYLALATLALSVIVIGVLVWIFYFLIKNPFYPLYFATDSIGRLIQIIPVDRPNMTTEEVTAWAIKAAQSAYSYDFINYRSQLQSAQKYFTTYGWTNYMKALTDSNNLLGMTQRKQIVIANVVGPPKILAQGILGGAYAWKFQMNMLVTYWQPPFDDGSRFSNPWEVTMIVQRQPILQSYQGLGVVQVVARFAGVSTQPQQISTTPT